MSSLKMVQLLRLESVLFKHSLCRCSSLASPVQLPVSPDADQTTESSSWHSRDYIHTTGLQKAILAVGSSVIGLLRPQRGDMVAVSGETTAAFTLPRLLRRINSHSEGQLVLSERPVIDSSTVDLNLLKSMPEGSLGREYHRFMSSRKFSADDRPPVRFIEDPALAYVMLRYRQSHDLVHTLLQMPTNLLGEVTVKCVEGLQTGLPMCIGAGILSPFRLRPRQREVFRRHIVPWTWRVGTEAQLLMTVHWESRWSQDLQEMRQELNIPPPPALDELLLS